MPMFELSIRSHFSAAHHLAGYPGSCASVHGHNWGVEVFVRGCELDETGILIDFRKLKETVRDVLAEVDHTDLNRVDALRQPNPTSEHIARFLFERLSAALNCQRYSIAKVTVCETPECNASYWSE
jgi:6-pyruvoyltetrahydropterin/6-carboxytetrahydropterin synthase